MLKKIIFILSFLFILLFTVKYSFSSCSYNGAGDITNALEECVGDAGLVDTGGDLEVAGGFKQKLLDWNTKIATFLALGAIFSIVFASFKLVLSAGEEEQIKKAKDIIKWGIIGLFAIVSAGFLISVIVKLIYSVGNV